MPENEDEVLEMFNVIDNEDESEADKLWNEIDNEYFEKKNVLSNYF